MGHPYRQLVSVLHELVGDSLRGAGYYYEDGFHLIFARPDLRTTAFKQRVEVLADRARDRRPLFDADEGIGPRGAGIELYENAVIVHFIETENRGFVTSLDPDVAQRLGRFVAECNSVL